jgi:ferredoxin
MADFVERKFDDVTVRIDRDSCIANESCMSIAPELFGLDDDQICVFKDPVAKPDRAKLIEACRVCPVDALTVLDASGNEIVP